jgi:hypothetical protein
MSQGANDVFNCEHVAADGRQRKRPALTPKGLQSLREAALRNKPWLHSTGPRTPEGKARSSQNGRYRQTDGMSRREREAELSEVHALLGEMAASRLGAIDVG